MTTKPGERFVIRRRALAMIKSEFDAKSIRFAYPTDTVAGGSGAGAARARVWIAPGRRRPALDQGLLLRPAESSLGSAGVDGEDRRPQCLRYRRATEAGAVVCGHRAVDPLRRALGDYLGAIAVEVGGGEKEFLRG
jgi:hypothetical protein